MFRYLVLPTLVALLLVPDWASAFFRRRATPAVVVPAQKVQYTYVPQCPPMFAAPVPCCPPAVVAPAKVMPAAPQVVPERMATPKPVAPDVVKPTPTPAPTTTPTPVPNPTTIPIPTPAPNLKPEKLVEPKPPSVIPNRESKLLPEPAPVETIKPVAAVEEKLPPISVPLTPVPVAKDPVVPQPVEAAPALPKLTFDPIPAKDVTPEEKPTPVKPDNVLPKLELPSLDLPAAPPLAVPKAVEVKSSPINAEKNAVAFEMFPVDGAVPANPGEKRIVTFYNFSGRDLLLTIDGKAYTLPAKHTVEGKLGTQFKMQIGIGEVQEMKVPMSAAGVDVVLKK
jgi:hypothetical protein